MWQKSIMLLLRLAMGWIFLYAGTTKWLDPTWSAAGYIKNAQTATWFYNVLLEPSVLPVVNTLVTYGLLLLGLSLIVGIGIRLGSILGSILMFLLYLPILTFPHAGKTAFIVDEHIVYILILLLLSAYKAGHFWGIGKWCQRLPWCRRHPRFAAWLE